MEAKRLIDKKIKSLRVCMEKTMPIGVSMLMTTAILCAPQSWGSSVSLKTSSEVIQISKPALYPETVLFNENSKKFLVGSFRDGAVYEVDDKGSLRLHIKDDRLSSVLGMTIDYARDRLLIVNSDVGASLRSYSEGPKKLAAVGIFSLSSGKPIHYVDLQELMPDGQHLANGIALDPAGNAYVTDSLSPVIYKVDVAGKATVFLQDKQFLGEGISLNGIVYHPNGYLIAVKKDEGILFKIPLHNPKKFTKVKMDKKLIGGDGLMLVGEDNLVVIANQAVGIASNAAFSLRSDDDWKAAHTLEEVKLGDVYPTTGVVKDGKIYVMHSSLNRLMAAPKEEKGALRTKATILQIGTVEP